MQVELSETNTALGGEPLLYLAPWGARGGRGEENSFDLGSGIGAKMGHYSVKNFLITSGLAPPKETRKQSCSFAGPVIDSWLVRSFGERVTEFCR